MRGEQGKCANLPGESKKFGTATVCWLVCVNLVASETFGFFSIRTYCIAESLKER